LENVDEKVLTKNVETFGFLAKEPPSLLISKVICATNAVRQLKKPNITT
jgi:hypothetical protein